MKVACLLGSLNRGGAELLVLDVLQSSRKTEIEFICIHRNKGDLFPDYQMSGVPLFHSKPKNKFDLFYFLKLRRLLLREEVEIIHVHQVIDALIAHIATLFTTIKVLQTFHGHGFNQKMFLWVARWMALKMNAVNIFVSRSQQESYISRFNINNKRNEVIYNSKNFSEFKPAADSNLRNELEIGKDALLTGSVGNFTGGRNQLLICKFLLLLHQEGIHFTHIFVGAISKPEPELYEQCVSFCEQNNLTNKVLFLGSRYDVQEILPQLDAFVYSSVHDTFGIAVIEAIAAGIPVFVNDWEVMLEITHKGKYASIYKSNDETDLLNQFQNFLSHPELYKTKAIHASEKVKKEYSIDKHISELAHLYTTILRN